MNLPDGNPVIFEHSAHVPQIEEPGLFNAAVIRFIEDVMEDQ